jgi:hypothetical protein
MTSSVDPCRNALVLNWNDKGSMEGLYIDQLTIEDSDFVTKALILAERANTGSGVFDIMLLGASMEEMQRCLHKVVYDGPSDAHINRKNYLVVRSRLSPEGLPLSNPIPVACVCVYGDECSVDASFVALGKASESELGWSDEKFQSNRDQISFLKTHWPDAPFEGSWWLESVFTETAWRGKGIQNMLISMCVKLGRDRKMPRAMLVVYTTNAKAISVYSKAGYREIGKLKSDQCQRILLTPGLDVMMQEYVYE